LTTISSKPPYWRLSGFYFFYFAALGALLPYWSLYLQALGYDHAQIGLLMALLPAAKLVSPTLWGALADRTGWAVGLIRLSSALSAASFALTLSEGGYAYLVGVMLLIGFFWNAPLPLCEAVTLSYLRNELHRYSRIRVWGSIGFIVGVLAVGKLLDTALLIECLPWPILALLVGMVLVSLSLPARAAHTHGEAAGALRGILRRPSVIAFFLSAMLIQIAHGPYYTFFSVYLRECGYDGEQTGLLWSLGVVAEIALFAFLHRLQRRYSVRSILLVSMLLGAARWLLIGWQADNPILLILAQTLHAASFGATHAAAVNLVHQHFAGAHHGKGQALYSSLSFGLGGMLGSYGAGEAWASLGPAFVFGAAAGASLLAWAIAFVWVEKPLARNRS
jgi:PPP family 3-phenylpropionic acid transporter